MNHLQILQQKILSAVYDETALVTAGDLVHATAALDAPSHIAIYRDSIRLGLAHALHEVYPVCARLLGDGYFAQLCEQYIQTNPSHSPDLNRYGLAFPEFICALNLAGELPWLPDVLRLERSWHKVFSGMDAVEFDLQCLSELTEQQSLSALVILQENMHLLESIWPIDKIWLANRDLAKEPDTIDLSELTDKKVCLLIWRDGLDMHLDVLTAEMACLLQSLRNRDSLQAACELIDKHYPDAEFSDLFGQIAANGWIAGVHLD